MRALARVRADDARTRLLLRVRTRWTRRRRCACVRADDAPCPRACVRHSRVSKGRFRMRRGVRGALASSAIHV